MEMLLSLLLIVVALASLWFWIRTLMVMNRENIGWTIGGFFVAPIVQIIFFLTQKDNLNAQDKSPFKLFFITQVALILLVVVTIIMASTLAGSV